MVDFSDPSSFAGDAMRDCLDKDFKTTIKWWQSSKGDAVIIVPKLQYK